MSTEYFFSPFSQVCFFFYNHSFLTTNETDFGSQILIKYNQVLLIIKMTLNNENRVQMHFNEFQMHLECITTLENDSQRICNVPQFIHETPPMFLNVQEWSWNDFQCISNALEKLHKACLENCKIRMKIIIFNSPFEWQREKLNKLCLRST